MTPLTKHFCAEELLPPGNTDTSLLDPKMLVLIDEIRELLAVPIKINDWAFGGTRKWCGLRTDECTVGAPKSKHRLGQAADLHLVGMSADDGRRLIRKAVASGGLPYLGAVELDTSWIHVDTRARINNKVLWFRRERYV